MVKDQLSFFSNFNKLTLHLRLYPLFQDHSLIVAFILSTEEQRHIALRQERPASFHKVPSLLVMVQLPIYFSVKSGKSSG